jgi:hypothetical protein
MNLFTTLTPTDHAALVWLAGILFACWSVR